MPDHMELRHIKEILEQQITDLAQLFDLNQVFLE